MEPRPASPLAHRRHGGAGRGLAEPAGHGGRALPALRAPPADLPGDGGCRAPAAAGAAPAAADRRAPQSADRAECGHPSGGGHRAGQRRLLRLAHERTLRRRAALTGAVRPGSGHPADRIAGLLVAHRHPLLAAGASPFRGGQDGLHPAGHHPADLRRAGGGTGPPGSVSGVRARSPAARAGPDDRPADRRRQHRAGQQDRAADRVRHRAGATAGQRTR